jgi:hypothetical protein
MLRSADFATSVLADMLERQPMSPGKLQFAWRAAVGPALARAAALEFQDGRITAHAASVQWKKEIERSKPIIVERLRLLLGRDAVRTFEVSCGSQ